MIRICVFCLRQFVVLFGPVSAAITVGRSVFVVCLCQFIALFDAGPAAITVGSSVSVCYAFVNLSLPGCDAVQVWERVNPVRCVVMLLRNMAGAVVVEVLRFSVPNVLVVCF